MKNLFFLFACLLSIGMSMTVIAQRTTFVNRNSDEKFATNVTTVDATPTNIDSFALYQNEGGIFETTVIGFAKNLNYTITGKIFVRFNRRAGTLVMAAPAIDMPIVADAALGASTFTYTALNGKIYLQATGIAATVITWTSITKRKTVWYIN